MAFDAKKGCKYVKINEDSQRECFIPEYVSRLKAPSTCVFDIFSTDFSEPLRTNARRMRVVLIFVNHLMGWLLAYPTSSATAWEGVALMKHFSSSSGRPGLIISYIGPCSTASSLEKFLSKYSIDWKIVMAYAPNSSGRVGRKVCTIKGAIARMGHRKPSDWDLAVPHVLYGYRRRGLMSDL